MLGSSLLFVGYKWFRVSLFLVWLGLGFWNYDL